MRGHSKSFGSLQRGVKKVWQWKFSIAQPPTKVFMNTPLLTLLNFHKICTQMSTKKPSIGAVVLEISSWILSKQFQISTFHDTNLQPSVSINLMAHNWQKWKRALLTCHCHKIYRVEAAGLKSSNYTLKITTLVNMWNLGQFRENMIFNKCLIKVWIKKSFSTCVTHIIVIISRTQHFVST